MVVVLAKIFTKPEHSDEVAGLFRDMVAWVQANEPGTLTYACNRTAADPSVFVFFERYRDQESFQAHSASARFAELAGSLGGKLSAPFELTMMDEVAAKL